MQPFADLDLSVSCRVVALIGASDQPTFGAGLVTGALDFVRVASFTSEERSVSDILKSKRALVRDGFPSLGRFAWRIGGSTEPLLIHRMSM